MTSSKINSYLDEVIELIKEGKNAKYIHEHLKQKGLNISYSQVCRFVRKIKIPLEEPVNNRINDMVQEEVGKFSEAREQFLDLLKKHDDIKINNLNDMIKVMELMIKLDRSKCRLENMKNPSYRRRRYRRRRF